MNGNVIGRREFLRSSAILLGGLTVAACADPAAMTGAEPSMEPIELRYHHRLGLECDNHGQWVEKFNEDRAPDVSVTMECFPGADYFKKLNTLIAGGTIGDAFWISSIEGYYRLAAAGASRALDDLVESSGFDLSDFYALNIEAARLNGELYGLPQLAHPGRVGLFYNVGLFEDAGMEPPNDTWTYDDLLAAAAALTDPDEGVYGFLPCLGYFCLLVYQRSWGGDMLNGDGTVATLDSDESIAALRFVSDLFHENGVAPLPGTMEQGTYQTFAANKLAMYQSGFWGEYVKNFVEEDAWAVAPMPIGADTGVRGNMFESDPVCVSRASENPAEMFDCLTYFTTFDAQIGNYNAMGAPSVRPDVMASETLQSSALMRVFGGIMDEALPLVLPANFRETEYFKTINEMLQVVWLGESDLDEVIGDVQEAAAEILAKPSLEA
ncbi:MAG: sugar ABC transporter substrate-binding protein [Caldilineaceae bacterium]|nr:sugar ABC transporter substrate-binding protein [Caldilineaceae bacterium]